jgi:hypothetical protein
LVEVALVVVLLVVVSRSIVDDARTITPIEVVVGRRLPETIEKASPNAAYPAGA